MIGSFLNAQGLRKTAYNMQPGIGRDLAMALTKPLVEVSAFLRLDRPRRGIQEVIGRGGADTIDTAVVVFPVTPEETGGPNGTETTAGAAGSTAELVASH